MDDCRCVQSQITSNDCTRSSIIVSPCASGCIINQVLYASTWNNLTIGPKWGFDNANIRVVPYMVLLHNVDITEIVQAYCCVSWEIFAPVVSDGRGRFISSRWTCTAWQWTGWSIRILSTHIALVCGLRLYVIDQGIQHCHILQVICGICECAWWCNSQLLVVDHVYVNESP